MATAVVTEYSRAASDANGHELPIPLEPAVASTAVTYTTSTQHTLNSQTKIVTVAAVTATAYVAVGTNPTATANSRQVASGTVYSFGVSGSGFKVAIYDGTS